MPAFSRTHTSSMLLWTELCQQDMIAWCYPSKGCSWWTLAQIMVTIFATDTFPWQFWLEKLGFVRKEGCQTDGSPGKLTLLNICKGLTWNENLPTFWKFWSPRFLIWYMDALIHFALLFNSIFYCDMTAKEVLICCQYAKNNRSSICFTNLSAYKVIQTSLLPVKRKRLYMTESCCLSHSFLFYIHSNRQSLPSQKTFKSLLRWRMTLMRLVT